MIWHVLGWTTVAAQAGVAIYMTRWLWAVGSRPWSWQRPPHVPKPTAADLTLSSGSDYVGVV